jgi:hypothetical protein
MQLCIRRKYRKLVFATALGFTAASFISPPLALAQTSTTGSINGTVIDSTGAAVPGAAVVLKDTATGAIVNLTTNAEGRFTAPFLRPDTFNVSATAAGFQSNTISVQILTGQQSVVNVRVSPSTNTIGEPDDNVYYPAVPEPARARRRHHYDCLHSAGCGGWSGHEWIRQLYL